MSEKLPDDLLCYSLSATGKNEINQHLAQFYTASGQACEEGCEECGVIEFDAEFMRSSEFELALYYYDDAP